MTEDGGTTDQEGSSAIRTLGVSVGLAIAGFLVGIAATLITVIALVWAGIDVFDQPLLEILVSVVMLQGVGFGSVALGYLYLSNRGMDFLMLRMPTLRDLAWTLGGLFALFGALMVMNVILFLAGIEGAEHVFVDLGEQNPEILLLLIPLSIVLIGPAEELLFRGLIQRLLVDRFGIIAGIGGASVIFAVAHVGALIAADPVELITTLGIFVILSVILGVVYEYGENLVIPSLIHGLFNAAQFALLYWVVTNDVDALSILPLI